MRIDPRPWLASIGLAALVVFLAVHDEFPLPGAHPPPSLSIGVESGASGTERDGSGPFWWLTSPRGTLWLLDTGDDARPADVAFDLVAPPCTVSQHVTVRAPGVDERVVELRAGAVERVRMDGVLTSAGEVATISIDVQGPPCSPGPADPRQLYVMVRGLSATRS